MRHSQGIFFGWPETYSTYSKRWCWLAGTGRVRSKDLRTASMSTLHATQKKFSLVGQQTIRPAASEGID